MKWDARLYDEQNRTREEAGRKLMQRAEVGSEEKVLDIGCGTGTLTAEMARLAHKGRVVGLDPSEDMLAMARAKTSMMDNITLTMERVEEMAFSEEFSLAFSNLALQWVKNQEGALRNIYNSLAPGGRIALHLPSRGFSKALSHSIDAAIDTLGLAEFRNGWKSPWYLPEKDEYETILLDAGFRGVKVSSENFSMSFSSSSAALDWALSAALVPYMTRLDWRTGEYFKYAVAMNFELFREEGGIVFDFRRLMALGHRPH